MLVMEPVLTTSLYEQLHGQGVELSSLEAADIVYDVASGELVLKLYFEYT